MPRREAVARELFGKLDQACHMLRCASSSVWEGHGMGSVRVGS